jgi:hypothetical protein
MVAPVDGDRPMRRQAGADPMKALVTTLVTGLLVTGGIAPVAAGGNEPTQPSAVERLVRQEDARRNDPALGATREWESVGIVDPWIAARVEGPLTNIPVAPSIEIVDPADGFDWSDALVGAAAAAAILAASAGLGLAVRTHGLRQA